MPENKSMRHDERKLSRLGCILIFTLTASLATEAQSLRVPAEWESHAATWMQWPGPFEAQMRPEFAEIIRVIQAYEPMHLLTSTDAEKVAAQQFLADRGVPSDRLRWHVVPVDNSWMRDNGPIYLTENGETRIQNWRFDAWGGNFGAFIPWRNDNAIPAYVGDFLGLEVENRQDYVLEKGNLEFNGAGTLVLNWDCQDDRNPGLSRAEHEAILTEAFGLSRIIWAYGHYPEDGTTGHIDGTARFIDEDTIAIADYGSSIENDLAAACEAAGLEVVWYPGDPNWLVGNGFVAGVSSGNAVTDADLESRLESYFPGRDVHMIDVSSLAQSGGGIHCVTNDQPAVTSQLFGDDFETGDVSRWSGSF